MRIYIIGARFVQENLPSESIELAKSIKLSRISYDHIKHYYFYKAGFDSIVAHNLEEHDFIGYSNYVKKFENIAIEKTIQEFKNHIIDIFWWRYYLGPRNKIKQKKNRIVSF